MKKLIYSLTFLLCCCPFFLRAQQFYRIDSVQQIELFFTQNNWSELLDTAKAGSGSYLMASVKLNGILYDSVGVKYKGNSSYSVSNYKNPFHIELNTFKSQNHHGYTDIKLSNGYGDPSLIREVLSYKIAEKYVKAPSCALARVYANGVYLGLYSSAESINNGFIARNFFGEEGAFVKCNPILTPGPSVKSNLKNLGEDTLAYFNYYELKSTNGWQDLVYLCRHLTIEDSVANIIDTEAALWMLAFNNLFVNLDSYTGAFAQNYYLYKDQNNRFTPILWDLNMSYGSFPFAGSPGNGMGSLTVNNRVQLSPIYHSNHADWPLIQTLLSSKTYLKRYYAHYQTLLEQTLLSGYSDSLANQLLALAKPFALLDTNKFFSDTLFLQSLEQTVNFGSYQVPGVSALMRDRANYLTSLPEFSILKPTIDSVYGFWVDPNLNSHKILQVKTSNAQKATCWIQTSREKKFIEYPLYDDGHHQDQAANDGIFGNSIHELPAHFNYYLIAENDLAVSYAPAAAPRQHLVYGQQMLTLSKEQLKINELVANNKKSDINEYGIYTDWFELYNTTNDTVDLYGTYASDKRTNPFKFAFPAGSYIAPKGFIGVWADNLPSKKFLHANLSLSSEGESLFLFNMKGEILDEIRFTQQVEDLSYARCPDGADAWVYMKPPTFMDSNHRFCASGIDESDQVNSKLYPNPAQDQITLQLDKTSHYHIRVINVLGQTEIEEDFIGCAKEIHIGQLKPGIYFIQLNDTYTILKFVKTE